MKKLIFILIAAVLFTTTACAAGNKTTTSKGVLPMKLNIQIDNGTSKHTITATLYDNSSSKALIELLSYATGNSSEGIRITFQRKDISDKRFVIITLVEAPHCCRY